ncbi:RNA polymerase sigma factor [Luteitalea pratensis]|uniref:RNA polymerase sigma factor n=1 Tax=Luteitalea pratensis TaxID=1855912 RepID=A0A143PIL4_LUTPR|nr:sigma-70 family RNA polymerase sigma factor [Luteitalea pratensis]AMY07928.1 RNA polymerase sigma factor [Luteitalea pratensis]
MAGQTVTQLLLAWADGDEAVLDPLMSLVYDELHRIARRHMVRERSPSLQPTALVHEAYLRLVGQSAKWQNRAHFFAVAARMMRRILVARARQCDRRGGGVWHVSLGEAGDIALERTRDLIALDDALKVLASVDYRKSQVVELRFFGGLSVEETAHILGVSAVTVIRDWTTAKAWLHRETGNRTEAGGL